MSTENPLNDPAADPFEVARDAAAVIADRSGIERHDIALTLGSGWGKARRHHRRDGVRDPAARSPASAPLRCPDTPARSGRSACRTAGTHRHRCTDPLLREPRRPSRGAQRPHRRGDRGVGHGADQRRRWHQGALDARHSGPHQRPHQPDGGQPARGRHVRRPDRPVLGTAARGREVDRPHPRRGRLHAVPRPALREPRRGADGEDHRRAHRRHVDRARGDRRPSGGHGGPRLLAHHEPRRGHPEDPALARRGARGRARGRAGHRGPPRPAWWRRCDPARGCLGRRHRGRRPR